MILQTLYQQCIRNQVNFYDEFQVLDLLIQDEAVAGVVAVELLTGELHVFHTKAVIIATGGHGRLWEITSNAYAYTGDGIAISLRRGIPAQDMEFFQFHPTGIFKFGFLITEGVRGEGGVLINGKGDRFMETYAPRVKDLASRDVTSRSMYLEMAAGRGINGERYLYLDVRPEIVNKYAEIDGRTRPDGSPYRVTSEEILKKVPDIIDFCRTYVGIDPLTQPMPVQPTAHYTMGGIPTNQYGQVVIDEQNTVMPGLYAAGEVACVSVHGANRLGTNSLLDLLVFGKHSGLHAAEFARGAGYQPLPGDATDFVRQQIDQMMNSSGKERPAAIGKVMKAIMFDHVGVFRTEAGMIDALHKIRELKERFKQIHLDDHGKKFNMDLLGAWELANMLDLAEVTTASALARQESRGAHAREDYPKRDDAAWLKHTLAWQRNGDVELRYKPVTITKFMPKERTY
jgi:succinate dehydrogenase / fumarate reductase flavoprotein subunit